MNSQLAAGQSSNVPRRLLWLFALLAIAIALAVVVTPIWLIQPFKPQTARGLAVSYALRGLSPVLTLICSIGVVLMMFRLWQGSRWFLKFILVLLLLPLFAATWMARQNHFEWMFRPDANVAFAAPADANFVADNDMVLGVVTNGEAVAYPVRLLAYHHLVHDVVGGVPIVATY